MSDQETKFQQAEDAILKRFAADGFKGPLNYDAKSVVENERWWYIPARWIGCAGFIVNKNNQYVNWLGSGVSLDLCFWGHDHGIVADLVDFKFTPTTDAAIVARLLAKFQHTNSNDAGKKPVEPVPYRESEIQSAVASQFPLFKNHYVWLAIPDIFQAHEKEGLRFTCSLADEGCRIVPKPQAPDGRLAG